MFHRIFSKPPAFTPSGRFTVEWNREVVVIGKLSSPTVELYFRSRDKQFNSYCEIDHSCDDYLQQFISAINTGTLVVLVRDVPPRVVNSLLQFVHLLSGISWFIDDDIPGIHLDKTLPKRYQDKLSRWYIKTRPLLEQICDRMWVSTPQLAKKYGLSGQFVLPPVQIKNNYSSLVRCFYHGSGSHKHDWEFALRFIEEIQSRYQNTWFELIGDHSLYKATRHIPRVQVLHPMKWDDYLVMTSNRIMDIGLAPLLDTPFNKVRSHTKFLDITRQNAIGLYSEGFSHGDDIKKSNAGLLVKNTIEDWVNAFDQALYTDRDKMLTHAQKLVQKIDSSQEFPV